VDGLDLLRWHNPALREVFAAHGGEEISTTGDGLLRQLRLA
jgi:hypothetical protein